MERYEWDTMGEHIRALLGRMLMLLAEYGATQHPASADQFYTAKAEFDRQEAQVDDFRRQLLEAKPEDFRF